MSEVGSWLLATGLTIAVFVLGLFVLYMFFKVIKWALE